MYYPKSKIKPDLYTNGEEYILTTTKEKYKGYYYELSSGKKYTGKNPQDGPNILITPPPAIPLIFQKGEEVEGLGEQFLSLDNPPIVSGPSYNNTPSNVNVRYLPIYNITLPTNKDKDLGVFNRYFCKKNNELIYTEINKETFDLLRYQDPKIAWDLYSPLSILWQIQGDKEKTYTANKNNIAILEQRNKWYGFSKYLKEDYLKYYLGS
jgi:hypothetical protein